jgi:hypothetical protein
MGADADAIRPHFEVTSKKSSPDGKLPRCTFGCHPFELAASHAAFTDLHADGLRHPEVVSVAV